MQNEIRGVLGRISADATGRILDYANPRVIRIKQKAVFVTAKTREHKFFGGNRGNLCVKKYTVYGTIRLQSEKRQEWIAEIEGE